MPRIVYFPCMVILAALLVAPGAHILAAASAKSEKNKAQTPDKNGCYKTVSMKGRPHRISAVAGLSAVRLWSEAAKKHGEEYAMWHNATGTGIKCNKLSRSDFFSCLASGKPCSSHAAP